MQYIISKVLHAVRIHTFLNCGNLLGLGWGDATVLLKVVGKLTFFVCVLSSPPLSGCRIENCDSCFSRDFCTKCKPGFYLYRGRCFGECPDGFAPLEETMECVGECLQDMTSRSTAFCCCCCSLCVTSECCLNLFSALPGWAAGKLFGAIMSFFMSPL